MNSCRYSSRLRLTNPPTWLQLHYLRCPFPQTETVTSAAPVRDISRNQFEVIAEPCSNNLGRKIVACGVG